nr:MAG TPA: hypothetical protein [Caudoviricetes sp.]
MAVLDLQGERQDGDGILLEPIRKRPGIQIPTPEAGLPQASR